MVTSTTDEFNTMRHQALFKLAERIEIVLATTRDTIFIERDAMLRNEAELVQAGTHPESVKLFEQLDDLLSIQHKQLEARFNAIKRHHALSYASSTELINAHYKVRTHT